MKLISTGYLAILASGLVCSQAAAQWTPVPPADFSSLQLSQFADNELDVPYHLYHFAQVANAVVENDFTEPGTGRFLPRGFLNIKVNREPVDNEPYNARIMEMQAALAYFYCIDRPWNSYRGNNAVRVRLEAMLERWSEMQNQPGPDDGDKDGLFTEYSPTGWGLAPTGFGVKNAAEALDLIHHSGQPFDAAVFDAAKTSLRRALMALFTRPDMRSAARTYSNQFSGSYHAALIYLENWPDAELDAAFIQAVNDSAVQDQSPTGFWYEQGGPDFGYSGVHEGNLKTALTRLRNRADLLPIVVDDDVEWNEWLAAMYVPQPGLSTRTFMVNGGINTRTSHSSWTPNSRPYSEFVVPSRIFSYTDTEYAASLVSQRSSVQAQFGTWGPLAVPSSGSYSPGFVTNAVTPLYVWHPTAAQRTAAHALLPCLSPVSTNRLYRDALPLAITAAKRPQYYAAASAGRIRVTRQVYGLGMLWNPSFGLALQSVSNDVNTNTWMFGTRRPGETRTYETYTTTASVTAAGNPVSLTSGVTDLASGDLVLTYPLVVGSTTNGQKSITMKETHVEVSVTHSGTITEVLPLAHASDASLSTTANTVVVARPNGSSLTIEITSPGASITTGNSSGFITGMSRRLVTLSANGSLTYRLTLAGAPPGPANALNIDSHAGGTFQWPTDSIWDPDTTSGQGPLAADSIGITGNLTGTTHIDYATGTTANRSISNIEVTDTENGSSSGAQVNFRAGVAESHLDFSINNPIISTNIINQNSGANRFTIDNPRFQPASVVTKAGSGNVRLNLLTTSSVASFQNNVTLLSAGGGLLWISPGSTVPIALPDINFGTFATSLVLSKGAFTANNRLISLGSGRLSMGDSGMLDITGTSTVSGGNVIMGSNNSGEFYLGGSATIRMLGGNASFQNLNMGDQKSSSGTIAWQQSAGITHIANTAFLGLPPSGNTGTNTQNLSIDLSGGEFHFTRDGSYADFLVGRNSRGANTGIVTLNGSVTLSSTGLLNLGPATRMVLGSDTSVNADNTSGTLNLNGGTLSTQREIARGQNNNAGGSDSAHVFFNGGTIRLAADIPELLTGFNNSPNDGLHVSNGGARIDTNGFDTAISPALVENPSSPGGGLTKLGAGTLTLAAQNTFGGITMVEAGTLALTNPSALQNSTYDSGGAGALSFETLVAATIGGLTGPTDLALVNNTSDAINLNVGANNQSTTFSGILTGTGALTKSGSGTLTLAAANSFTGDTRINAGTLALANASALQNSTFDSVGAGAMAFGALTAASFGGLKGSNNLALANNSASAVALSVGGNNQNTGFSGNLTGPGSLLKTGSGALTLSGLNSYAGNTTVGSGTLAIAATQALPGYATVGRYSVSSGATLAVTDGIGETDVALIAGTGNFTTGSFLGIDTTVGNRSYGSPLTGSINVAKLGANTLTFTASQTYTGITQLREGTLLLSGASDRLNTASSLSLAGNATLDLGGNSQILKGIGNAAGTYSAAITNGSLTVQAGGALTLTPAQTTNGQTVTLDMSGLSSFAYNNAGQPVNIGGGGPYGNTLDLRLSTNTNTITASRLSLDAGGSAGNWPFNKGLLRLGAVNTLNIGNGTGTAIQLSGYRSSGNTITFNGDPSSSSLKIRAADGTSRAGAIIVSQGSSGTSAGQPITASFDLGMADALVGDIIVADTVQTGTGVTVIGAMTMSGGTLGATSLTLGRVNTGGTPTNTNTLNGSFTQSGGTATITTLTLGNVIAGGLQTTGTIPRFESTCTIGGGATLEATTINANPGGWAFRDTSVRKLKLNGGTLRNITGSDLTVSGAESTPAGRIDIVLSGANNIFEATPGQTIDIQATAPISGSGNLVKQGDGTLSLKGTNTYSGETIVNAGTLETTDNQTLADGFAVRLATGTTLHLDFTGGDTVDRLYINGTEQASGTWGGLASSAANKTALITGGGVLTVTNGTAPLADFESWANLNNVTGGPNGDDDHDGVKNLIEYALADGQERGSLTGDAISFTKRGAPYGSDISYIIETSEDLGVNDPWTPVMPDENSETIISHNFRNPGDNFVRLKVSRIP